MRSKKLIRLPLLDTHGGGPVPESVRGVGGRADGYMDSGVGSVVSPGYVSSSKRAGSASRETCPASR